MADFGSALRGYASVLSPQVAQEVAQEDQQKRQLQSQAQLMQFKQTLEQQTPEYQAHAQALKNELGYRDAMSKLPPDAGYDVKAKIAGQFGKPELQMAYIKAQEDRAARLQQASETVDLKREQMNQTHELALQRITDSNARQAEVERHNRAIETLTKQGNDIKQQLAGLSSPDTTEKVDLKNVAPVDLHAAYRYFADGTLPPNIGRGVQGMAESRRIRNIAAEISASLGISPEDVRANQMAFKGNATAMTQLIRREAGVGANVRNFDFNADQVLKLSQEVDRTGVPVVNRWLNAGRRSVSGDPQLAAFDVAVKTTVNEFAQIVSGTTAGATTEGEKKKAEDLLNAQQTPQAIVAVVNQMRIESQNRMRSFSDEKQRMVRTMIGGGAQPQPAAPAAPAAAPATGGLSPDEQTELDSLRKRFKK